MLASGVGVARVLALGCAIPAGCLPRHQSRHGLAFCSCTWLAGEESQGCPAGLDAHAGGTYGFNCHCCAWGAAVEGGSSACCLAPGGSYCLDCLWCLATGPLTPSSVGALGRHEGWFSGSDVLVLPDGFGPWRGFDADSDYARMARSNPCPFARSPGEVLPGHCRLRSPHGSSGRSRDQWARESLYVAGSSRSSPSGVCAVNWPDSFAGL